MPVDYAEVKGKREGQRIIVSSSNQRLLTQSWSDERDKAANNLVVCSLIPLESVAAAHSSQI
eukprot:12475621-Prorocentrum_lima.AAC.1